jgi:hypothetical protein
MVPGVWAQVDVSVTLSPSRAVLHEPVLATVEIRNNTGQPLVLRDDDAANRLWFDIESRPGRSVALRAGGLLDETVTVAPRGLWRSEMDLTRLYDLREAGPYTVRARLNAAGVGFVSGRVFLDVVPGFPLLSERAVASAEGEMRVYELRTLNRERGEHLFLRIDDVRRTTCYAVIHLGRLVRMREPQMLVDGAYHVNVLHQFGPGRFVHHRFRPDGTPVLKRVYTGEGAGVRMEFGPDGQVTVTGASADLLSE